MNNHRTTCDPDRIELFLEEKLPDEEQMAFESHLNDCDDCRRSLEATAASEEVWSGVVDSLRGQQLLPDCQPGDSAIESSTGEDHSSSQAHFSSQTMVLKLLAPTDDDRMLGRWGTYEVVGVVGTGGMGVVLKAFDAALNRYVAIKILAPHLGCSGAARKRFSREAQAAAAVVHDNVIEIYGVSEAAGLPYLIMPYVRGPSLQRRLDSEGPLALVEILRVGMQAAAGLAAAHAQGLVHRDVKPANILLSDGVERVKLTDFGLARAADDASLTQTGVIAGTPQYMSPEQARGESVDQRSDLFSLGSVLYAMCTGRIPFRAETSYGVLRRITDEEPRPIREINPEIPEWLCQIVARLMAKSPEDRFQSAQEVAALLEQCLAHVQQPTTVPLPRFSPLLSGEGPGVRVSAHSPRLRNILIKGTLAMLTVIGISLFTLAAVSTNPPDMSGNWQGEGWGQVTLKQTAPGEYTGTYTETVAKEKEPGKIELKWSRIECRFNGTWREGDDRFGELSIRLVDKQIHGALTTDAKSKINPATPRLADLLWTHTTSPLAAPSVAVWDVTKDFSIKKGNPNGAWTYGWVNHSAFVPFTSTHDDADSECWHAVHSGVNLPGVGVWRGGEKGRGIHNGQFAPHPGFHNEASIARWTAPKACSPRVHVRGQFYPGDIGIMDCGIFVNGIPQVTKPYWHAIDSGKFDFVLQVSKGDTIDFAVYGGYNFGTTPLEATITAMSEIESESKWEPSLNHALHFDGFRNTHVDMAHPTNLPTGMRARTVAGWFRLTNTKDRGAHGMVLVAYGPNATSRRFNLYASEKYIGVELCLGSVVSEWKQDMEWHHLAAVVPENCSRLNQVQIYLDGVLRPTARYTTPPGVTGDGSQAFDTGSGPLSIGQTPDVEYLDQREGTVREICIYDRALSPAEIGVLHSNPAQASSWGMVLGYHCDEGKGTTVHDFAGNGNDGTLHGNMQWVWEATGAEKTSGTVSATAKIALQRITTLEALVLSIDARRKSGLATLTELYDAQDALINAQLESAKSKTERVAIWEKLLKSRQDIEKQIEAKFNAGVEGGSEADMLRARAARQQAEIGWEEAKQGSGAEKVLGANSETSGNGAWEMLGLDLRVMPPEVFNRRFQTRYRGGLAVADVRPKSPAAEQGIRACDVLVGIHIWETLSLDNVAYILKRPDLSKIAPLKFYILRGNETLYGFMSVDAKVTARPVEDKMPGVGNAPRALRD